MSELQDECRALGVRGDRLDGWTGDASVRDVCAWVKVVRVDSCHAWCSWKSFQNKTLVRLVGLTNETGGAILSMERMTFFFFSNIVLMKTRLCRATTGSNGCG